MSVSDAEHHAIALLRAKGWICFKAADGADRRRPSAIAALNKGTITLVTDSVLAVLSPFDAEELGRDLVSLAEDVIAHPNYPG